MDDRVVGFIIKPLPRGSHSLQAAKKKTIGKGQKMPAEDLITKWEAALQKALAEEPLQPELSIEDLESLVGVPTRSHLRSGSADRTWAETCW